MWGIRFQVAWEDICRRAEWQLKGQCGYLHRRIDQLSKYIKNNINHVFHCQARVRQEKREKSKNKLCGVGLELKALA